MKKCPANTRQSELSNGIDGLAHVAKRMTKDEILPPLHLSAYHGQTAALKRLIKAGCNVNQAAKDGKTPAFVAA